MAMNVGELNYSLGIEDNTKADMAKAKAALRKLEEQGATIPVDADIGKLTSSPERAPPGRPSWTTPASTSWPSPAPRPSAR